MIPTETDAIQRLATFAHADLPGFSGSPRPQRFVGATVVALALSLGACWVVATATVALDPALRGYQHFQINDWAKLMSIGVVVACCAWPVATLIWTRARMPFLVCTIAVTVASFIPDAWILFHGQPPVGVLALAVMHVAVALAVYPALVLIAPQRR